MKRLPHLSIVALLPWIGLHGAPPYASHPVTVRVDTVRLRALPVVEQQHLLDLADRMQRILAVDRHTLSIAERRALWNELSALQQEAAVHERDGTVIHISGAG